MNISNNNLISIICPCFNEEASINQFYSTVSTIVKNERFDFEFIFINDGSSDNTKNIIESIIGLDKRVKLINLSRNFGKEAALSAGIDYCSGSAAIPIDIDLQDPPELITSFIKEWQKGFDVVVAKRRSRKSDSFLKEFSALLYYRTHNLVSEVKIPENVGDFRLISRKVINTIRSLPENQRFMKGIFSWVGFSTKVVEYDRPARISGDSSFNSRKLFKLALDGITSFSTFPIRIWLYIGLTIATFSALYGLWIIFRTLIYGADAPGYASTIVIILFFGGLQLTVLGLLGEYIGRIYLEAKRRPNYIVDDTNITDNPYKHES
ncbi:glycosyltransferase family 2 protein [Vibrio breoganii]|uniref:glycosyltransferase family 2 protein n=2 Tax=Vibrio breoganii TaxID=553239 RepID=UPI000C851B9A|nr:glycosyltransferase family 2 protein [Vibrio breoganii]